MLQSLLKKQWFAADIANDFALLAGVVTGVAAKSVNSGPFSAITTNFTTPAWTLSGAVLTITDTDATGGADIDSDATAAMAITRPAAATTPANLVVATTNGVSAADAATPMLTLKNMANNGTVELNTTNATGGVVVTMKDATSLTADVLNVVLSDALTPAGVDVGKVVVNSVETVNVTANDAFLDTDVPADGMDNTNAAHTVNITGDAIKTVNVYGAGDVSLSTTSSVLTKVDASAMKGALTYTASVNSVVVTGGSAADKLTANANDVKLNGGAGNDTLTVNAGDRVVLNGGDGADTFVIAGASSTSSTYANITTVNSGDTIQFTNADSFVATKVTLSVGATETTQALMDLAIQNLGANDMGWFQTGGNTFIVMDVANSGTTFTGGTDKVVMITGLVDLSTASYNATSNTLEIA